MEITVSSGVTVTLCSLSRITVGSPPEAMIYILTGSWLLSRSPVWLPSHGACSNPIRTSSATHSCASGHILPGQLAITSVHRLAQQQHKFIFTLEFTNELYQQNLIILFHLKCVIYFCLIYFLFYKIQIKYCTMSWNLIDSYQLKTTGSIEDLSLGTDQFLTV